MAFEQEIQLIVNIICILTILVALILLIILYLKTKNNRLFWYVGSLLSGSIGYYFLSILLFNERNVPQPMISEENSRVIMFSVCFWIIGMVFLSIGFWRNNMLKGVNR